MMMMSGGSQPTFAFAGAKQNFLNFANLSSHGNTALITGFKVYWNDSLVGLEVFFNGVSAGLVKGNLNGKSWEESFNLSNGDYVVEIFGRHSNIINCFGFKTAGGFTKVWGNPCQGQPYNFSVPGKYIKALNYGVTDYLCYLEPIYNDIDFVHAKLVPFTANGKTTEALGKNGVGAEGFDDAAWISNMMNYNVAEVKIFHDGVFCYGIQTFYHLDGTKKSPGTHMIFANNLKADSLVLEDDEHITHAIVRAGDIIDSISLYTDRGRKFKCGGEGGLPYVIYAPKGMHIVAFKGTLGDRLSRLQAFCDEIF